MLDHLFTKVFGATADLEDAQMGGVKVTQSDKLSNYRHLLNVICCHCALILAKSS